MSTKSHLRHKVRQLISCITEASRKRQSESIQNQLIKHKSFKDAERISIYLSTSSEVDTIPLVRYILEKTNKQCFIPMVTKNKTLCAASINNSIHVETRMIMVRLYSTKDYDLLPINKYGIKEPNSIVIPETLYLNSNNNTELPSDKLRTIASPNSNHLDLIIVPCLAYTKSGERLGHGKAYYDEYFSYWMKIATKKPYTIGICFLEQILNEPLALSDHDYIVNEVLMADETT